MRPGAPGYPRLDPPTFAQSITPQLRKPLALQESSFFEATSSTRVA